MIPVKKHGIFLERTTLPFENKAVLNPTCYQEGDTVHLFYRAVSSHNISSIGYCKLSGPLEIIERKKEPVLIPEYDYEKKGIEDPRLVKIEDTFYLTYTAFDGINSRIAYATSKKLPYFEKQGIISANIPYQEAENYFSKSRLKDRYYFFSSHQQQRRGPNVLLWEKDGILFPKKINGKFALIHRVLPDIQLIYFDNFKQLKDQKFWKEHLTNLAQHVIIENTEWFEIRNIGGGAPPIETEVGWILIYHTVRELNITRTYYASAALLDVNDPLKLVGKLKNPLFSPEEDWERSGDIRNTIFPTGTTTFGNQLYIYYGAADARIGVASIEMDDFLRDLVSADGFPQKR